MRKMIVSLLASLSSLLVWQDVQAKNCKLDVGAGYRQDKVVWELAGPDDIPEVMSRLSWDNLRIFEIEVECKKITCQNFYFRGNADWGWIFDGKNRDTDYRLDERTDKVIEFSRSDNKANKGQVYDASVGAGYFSRWCFGLQKLRFAPVGGFSWHEQHLHIYDGYQVLDLDDPIFEGHHFQELDSTYKTRWYGPWAGLDLYFHLNEKITIYGAFEYHWMHYHARGRWNLRDDIIGDFHHTGFGNGYFTTISADYNFCNRWYMGAQFKFNFAHIHNGKDKTVVGIPVDQSVVLVDQKRNLKKLKEENPIKLHDEDDQEYDSSGSSVIPFNTEGKLRSVKWYSFSFLFTVGYNF